MKVTKPRQYRGVVQGHSGEFGFLICQEDVEDLFIPSTEMQKVITGDHVVAVANGVDARGRVIAKITQVVERKLKNIVGRVVVRRNVLKVIPEDTRIPREISIDMNGSLRAKDSQIVVVSIDQEGIINGPLTGRIIEVLGDIGDPGMEVEIAVRKFNLPYEFSDDTKDEVLRFSDRVTKKDLKNRIDLRDVPFVTIDGADAKDFDDAVYCKPMKNGDFRLLVAIADVSYYVRPGCAIDIDAQHRTTSVYFPRKVLPMLPEELSNGLCSLNPMVDRCTLVCDAIVDGQGIVKAYQFYPAVIRSAARLIYDDVWLAISNPKSAQAEKLADVLPEVHNLYRLFKILLKGRELRGAMDFQTVETYVVANAQGKIEKILPRERNDAHRLIEEMMLVANTCAADFIKRNKVTSLYRIHEPPSEDKLEKVRSALAAVGLHLGGGDEPKPSDYCKVLEAIQDRPDKAAIQTLLLRSMQQAVYSPINLGHFGLSYPAYTHFTSPIRRYPDLLVHRTIRALLQGKKYIPKVLVEMPKEEATITLRKEEKRLSEETKLPHQAVWEKLGLMCSANERRADEASYDVMAWLKCYYMKQHIGEAYEGTITGVSRYALFVTLNDLYVEGGLHVSELPDYFEYDEERNILVGGNTGKIFKLGQSVKVIVKNCDLDARRIEFGLIQSKGISRSRGTKSEKSSHKKATSRRMANTKRATSSNKKV